MKNPFVSIITAGVLVLIVSVGLLYASIYLFHSVMENYYDPVFRSSSFNTDWLFYLHPFVLSAAMYWFWDHSKNQYKGSVFSNALKVALVYGVVALLPVLLLTFSAINVSALMVITWLPYGIVQAFVAGYIFAKNHPA